MNPLAEAGTDDTKTEAAVKKSLFNTLKAKANAADKKEKEEGVQDDVKMETEKVPSTKERSKQVAKMEEEPMEVKAEEVGRGKRRVRG